MRYKTLAICVFLCVFFCLSTNSSPDLYDTIKLKGKWTWELFLDIDNSQNSGSITRVTTFKRIKTSSYRELIHSVDQRLIDASASGSGGMNLFGLLKVEMKGSASLEAKKMYDDLVTTQTGTHTEVTRSDIHIVGPHSNLTLYYLVFDGPGVRFRTETLSSTPYTLDDVDIEVKIKYIPVLTGIEVRYTKDAASQPNDVIEMAKGHDPNLNKGFKGDFVWLVPKWSTDPKDWRLTNLQVIQQFTKSPHHANLGQGDGNKYFRHLIQNANYYEPEKIVRVALYRTDKESDDPLKNGWTYKSRNINRYRGGNYLYVVWEKMPVLA